jgi:hypothetical protein
MAFAAGLYDQQNIKTKKYLKQLFNIRGFKSILFLK